MRWLFKSDRVQRKLIFQLALWNHFQLALNLFIPAFLHLQTKKCQSFTCPLRKYYIKFIRSSRRSACLGLMVKTLCMLLEPCIVGYFPVVSTCKTMGPKKCEQTKGNLSSLFPEDMVKLQKNHLKNICKCKEEHDNVNFWLLLTFENWFSTDKSNLTEPQVKWRDIFFTIDVCFLVLKFFWAGMFSTDDGQSQNALADSNIP